MQLLVYKRSYTAPLSYQRGDIIETRPNSFWLLTSSTTVQQWDKTAFYVIQIDDVIKTKEIDTEMVQSEYDTTSIRTILKKRIAGIDIDKLEKDYPDLLKNNYLSLTDKDFKKYYKKAK